MQNTILYSRMRDEFDIEGYVSGRFEDRVFGALFWGTIRA